MKKKVIAATLVLGCAAPVALVAGAGVVGIGIFAGSSGSNEVICADSSLSVSVEAGLPSGIGDFTGTAARTGDSWGVRPRGSRPGS